MPYDKETGDGGVARVNIASGWHQAGTGTRGVAEDRGLLSHHRVHTALVRSGGCSNPGGGQVAPQGVRGMGERSQAPAQLQGQRNPPATNVENHSWDMPPPPKSQRLARVTRGK